MAYRERVSPPLLWWLLAGAFALSLGVAVLFYLGWWWALGATGGAVALCAAGLRGSGYLIVVDATWLRVGRARIEHRYLAGCRALGAADARRRGGRDADARAYLVLRPWVATAVEVSLDDPDDPVPYWLVSSRRSPALAAALASAISAGAAGSQSPVG